MADKKVNIEIGSKANPSGFNMALGWFNQLRGGMSLFMGGAIMTGITSALGKIVDFGRGAVKAFADSEDGEQRLRTALQNSGGNVKAYMASYVALAEKLQQTTKYEDDAIVSEMAHAVSLGVSKDKITAMTTAAVGLSAKLGVDLGSAFDILIKAGNGSYMMFERASGNMKLTGSNAEKMATIMKFAQAGMSNAAAATSTYNGAQAQLNNTWGNTKELIGGILVDTLGLVEAMKSLNGWIDKFNSSPQAKKNTSAVVDAYKTMFKDVAKNPASIGAAWVKAIPSILGAATSDIQLPSFGGASKSSALPGSNEYPMQAWAANEARKGAALEAIAANTQPLSKLANPQ